MWNIKTKAFKWLMVATFATLFGAIALPGGSQAATGINSQVSFEGKVVNTSGTNIADGTYNLQFKIYQDGAGCVAGGSSPCGGTLKWTESRLVINSQAVTITAGTFQVNLGSINPLTGIDWNQDTLWLSMNIGGTNSTASPTYDGEMTPFIRLTSVPYALNAGMVGGLTASQLVQLTPGSTQSGTVDVSGNIKTGGSVQTTSLDAASAASTLSVGAVNSSTLNLGPVGSTATAASINLGTSTGAAQDINFGGTGASGGSNAGTVVTAQGGSSMLWVQNNGAGIQTFTNSATAFQIQNAAAAPIFLVDTTSTAANGTTVNYLQYPGFETGSFSSAATGWAASAPATLAQNNNKVSTYNGLFSAAATTTASNGGITTSSFISAPPAGNYLVSFFAKASSNITSDKFVIAVNGGGSCSPAAGITINNSGFQRLYCQLTASATVTTFTITQNDGTARTIYFDAVQLQSTTFNGSVITLPSPYQIGAIQLRGVITNPVALINNGDSTSAFQIQNAGANSNLFVADTLNTRIGVGTSAPAALFSVGATSQLQVSGTGSITTSGTYNGNTFSSSQLLFSAAGTATVQSASGQSLALNTGTAAGTITTNAGTIQRTTSGGSTTTIDLSDTGTTVLKIFNSSTGVSNLWLYGGGLYTGAGQTLRMDNSGNLSNIGTISSTGAATFNGSVLVGSSTTDATQNNLQFDSFNTFADSGTCAVATNQGAMYYNSNTGSMRACVNGSWEDMVSTAGLGLLAFGVVPDSANSGNIGEIAGIAQTTSPCKVYWSAIQQVTVAPCYAYSGGRKVIVPLTNLSTSAVAANAFVNVCLSGAGGAPTLQLAASITETTAAQPTWSQNNPVECIATLLISGTAGNITAGKIYDTRTFTTTQKSFATSNTALANGFVVIQSTANLITTTATATVGNVRGVVVAYSGATSTTTANTIIATAGPQFVKAIAASTVAGNVTPSATTGYSTTVTNASTATNYYNMLGVATRTLDTTCTSNATCQYSQFLNPLNIR